MDSTTSGKPLTLTDMKHDVQHLTAKLSAWAADIVMEAARWPKSVDDNHEILYAMRESMIRVFVHMGSGERSDIVDDLANARKRRLAECAATDMDSQAADVAVEVVKQPE